jgi:hypothetical protein
MKRFIPVVASAAVLAALTACAGRAKDEPAPPQSATERGTVHLIKLPEAPVDLPAGRGRESVIAHCAVCHSLAYIPIQPPLSRETWTAVVTKMQKTYSAPIPDDKLGEIIEYLVAVRGPAGK